MKVRAKAQGYYGEKLHSVGDEFEISSEKAFSHRWMEKVELSKEPEPEVKPKGKRSKEAKAQSSGDTEVI